MLNSLLVNVADKTRTVGIDEAALYALLGFAVVVLGIVFLIFVIWLVGKAMNKVNGVEVVKKSPQPPAVKESQQSVAVSNVSDEITEETVAIITAAIMAYYQQTNPKCEFTVKRIKRI